MDDSLDVLVTSRRRSLTLDRPILEARFVLVGADEHEQHGGLLGALVDPGVLLTAVDDRVALAKNPRRAIVEVEGELTLHDVLEIHGGRVVPTIRLRYGVLQTGG